MHVLIKMEMPHSCWDCIMSNLECDWCILSKSKIPQVYRFDKRPKYCPLIPIQPHGDLIDRDALMNEFEKAQRTMQQHGREYSCSFMSSSQEISTEWYCIEDMLDNAPIIIPASEDG